MSIKRVSHTSVYVLDQDASKAFYTDKLGFEVRSDQTMDGFRWLTVGPAEQPDMEIVLMPLNPSPMMDEETVATLRSLLEKGAFGGGVLETDDCQGTYETLRERGVEFMMPPTERPYGTECVFRDNAGTWFSLVQRPA